MSRKFLVDFMLGRLARWLRITGVDAAYFRGGANEGIIYRSLRESRIILTRNRALSRRKALELYLVENLEYRKQLKEVYEHFNLKFRPQDIFSRCPECNKVPEEAKKEEVRGKVPDYVFKIHNEFSLCPGCGRIYWRGTHTRRVIKIICEAGLVSGILNENN